jgi:hypothetical protein
MVCLWAIAASLVPAMQKGSMNARNAHIAVNTGLVGLFGWQVRVYITYMCLFVCVCIYMCVYICIYVYIYIWCPFGRTLWLAGACLYNIYVFVCVCLYIYVCVYMYICIYIYMVPIPYKYVHFT